MPPGVCFWWFLEYKNVFKLLTIENFGHDIAKFVFALPALAFDGRMVTEKTWLMS